MLETRWGIAVILLGRWILGKLYPESMANILETFVLCLLIASGLCYALNRYLKKYPLNEIAPTTLKHTFLQTLLIRTRSSVEELALFFWPILIFFLAQSFLFDTNYIASGSMKPTLKVGDMALSKKYPYGLRLPFKGTQLMRVGLPKRGDIITFRSPQKDHPKIYIKRVVGLPGDHIQYTQKCLIINGERLPQRLLGLTQDDDYGPQFTFIQYEETLEERKYTVHKLLEEPYQRLSDNVMPTSWQVPEGHYFFIGDNRDGSLDSRSWGFVPEHCLRGRADFIIFSWNQKASWKNPLDWVRWNRLFTKIV